MVLRALDLPVFASTDATLGIAQVQKLKDLVLRHLILVFVFVLILMIRLLAIALLLHLIAAVLFEDLKTSTETLALLSHEDSLFCTRRNSDTRFFLSMWVVMVVPFRLHGHCRLSRQMQ